jgi:hypothetical protein
MLDQLLQTHHSLCEQKLYDVRLVFTNWMPCFVSRPMPWSAPRQAVLSVSTRQDPEI